MLEDALCHVDYQDLSNYELVLFPTRHVGSTCQLWALNLSNNNNMLFLPVQQLTRCILTSISEQPAGNLTACSEDIISGTLPLTVP